MPAITILKADGTKEQFDPQKLAGSLRRAGADADVAQEIAEEIARTTPENTTTHEVYSRAFDRLREHRRVAAARYSLKRAVLDLGPSGFPFEAYLAEIFRTEGYAASLDRHVQGVCVPHEVDVTLEKGDEKIFVEAKFHNTAGFKTDLQVVLYVKARIDDIRQKEGNGRKIRGMIATNTKFTSLAVAYARCAGLELLGWDYPEASSLHERIAKAGLYPITALTTLSGRQKTALLAERVVLCRDLPRHEDAMARAGVSEREMPEVLLEAGGLCGKVAQVQ